jgi:membrane-associated phospholipid phosphatase
MAIGFRDTSPPATPGTGVSPMGRVLGTVDDAGEALFAPLRGRPWADAAAAAVSNLADYGVVWVALAGVKALRPGRGRRRAVLALAAAGGASYAVNRAVKQLVGRERPPSVAGEEPGALPVRRPSSTSFPSGHVLAAFCTALVLPESRSGRRRALTFATAVGASRVHLRAHHASDVLAGALLGAGAGSLLRRLVDVAAGARERRAGAARPCRGHKE